MKFKLFKERPKPEEENITRLESALEAMAARNLYDKRPKALEKLLLGTAARMGLRDEEIQAGMALLQTYFEGTQGLAEMGDRNPVPHDAAVALDEAIRRHSELSREWGDDHPYVRYLAAMVVSGIVHHAIRSVKADHTKMKFVAPPDVTQLYNQFGMGLPIKRDELKKSEEKKEP